jgi:peroxiredoxin
VPTRWFLLLVVIALVVARIVAARAPLRTDAPPGRGGSARPSPTATGGPAPTDQFRFVDLTGQPAPDFTLSDLNGKKHTLSEYRGRVVMLVFWATWCKTCPTELPHLGVIARSLAPKGLVTLGLNWETDENAVAKMVRDSRFDAPVLRDPEQHIRHDYDAWSVPRVIIVDRTGKVARVIRGYEGEATPIVKALADQGLALPEFQRIVRPVPVEKVRPAGGH